MEKTNINDISIEFENEENHPENLSITLNQQTHFQNIKMKKTNINKGVRLIYTFCTDQTDCTD